MAGLLGTTNVGQAWVAIRYSAKGSKSELEKQVDSDTKGIGITGGSNIGGNITKSIADSTSMSTTAKKINTGTKGIGAAAGKKIGEDLSKSLAKNTDVSAVAKKISGIAKGSKKGSKGDGGFLDSLLGKNKGSDATGILGKAGSLLSLSGSSLGGTAGGIGGIVGIGAIAQGLGAATVAAGGLAAAFAPISGKIMPMLTKQWGTWSSQIDKTKSAKSAISAASGAFGSLLKALTPLTMAMLPSLTRLFKDVGKSAQSGGLKTFLTWMAKNAPNAFNAVARGVRIASGAIKFLKPFISNIADTFKAFFHVLDAGFDVVGGLLDLLTGNWKAAGKRFSAVWNNIKAAAGDLFNALKTEFGFIVGLFGGLPGRALKAIGSLGKSLFNFGKTLLTDLWNGAKSKLNLVTGFFKGLGKSIIGALGKFLHFGSPSKTMFKLGSWIMQGLHNGINKHVSKVTGTFAGMGKNITSGVAQWTGLVQRALKLEGLPTSLTSRILYQMQTESGGNPRAINLTDINAQNGDPSRGLMQVIGSTFAANHVAGTSSNIYDPLANIAAAIAYASHRYGPTLMSGGMGIGSGHGYDSGGIAKGLGVMPKYTIKPERVLSPQQTSSFERLVDAISGRSGGAQPVSFPTKLSLDIGRSEAVLRDWASQEARDEIKFANR